MNSSVDTEKVDIAIALYGADWYKMAAYDQDDDDVSWHVENCMNYIITLSEDRVPVWNAPASLVLASANWSEIELLLLYQALLGEAAYNGYTPDPGMMTRINKTLAPRRRRASRIRV